MAKPIKKQKPLKMLRLTLNLVKTEQNQTVIDEVLAFAKTKQVQGPHACLRKEVNTIVELCVTQQQA